MMKAFQCSVHFLFRSFFDPYSIWPTFSTSWNNPWDFPRHCESRSGPSCAACSNDIPGKFQCTQRWHGREGQQVKPETTY